jgi:HAD superfamily hydrolase (TIGR01509 family)
MLVIFDCDGVLVDSEVLSAQVLSECFQDEGLAVTAHDVVETYRGKSVPDCVAIATRELAKLPAWQGISAEELAERTTVFWRGMQSKTLEACKERLQPIPGVESVLQSLQERGVPFAVGSNGKHEKMAITLAITGLLSYVKGRIFSYEDVACGKPAPDLFLYAAKTLGVDPAETVVVEDSLTGIQAALAAGMRPLAFCPPEIDGRDNALLPQVRALGITYFTRMDQLLGLIFR